MGRRTTRNRPDSASVLTTFAQFREVIGAFSKGEFSLIVVMGRPGLTKSHHVRSAISGSQAGYIKGAGSKLAFYNSLYMLKDKPIVLDDTNELLKNKANREIIRDLTETDTYKKLGYDTTSEKLSAPSHFYTTSNVCFITNYWDASDPVFQALESRAEFFVLDITWEELHQDVGRWFWDQEIYDYIQERLHLLKEPDARLYKKAHDRKKAGIKLTPWKSLIDDHCDDDHGLIIRALITKKYESDSKRHVEYVRTCKEKGMRPLSRSNFFARLKRIRAYIPERALPRIKLTHNHPPIEIRPQDAFTKEDDKEDEESEE